MMKDNLYIGLMSGTSLDGIDAALLSLTDKPRFIASNFTPFDNALRSQLASLQSTDHITLTDLGVLDTALGRSFANACHSLITHASILRSDVVAIGSHGQTIFHHPKGKNPFTLQIGDPNIIAAETGITTVADFRRKDMAMGGQGAPLAPAFHQLIFGSNSHDTLVLNIGGIANLTKLPMQGTRNKEPVLGFDCGPGNALMDEWCERHTHRRYDHHGEWAASGSTCQALLTLCLEDTFFQESFPKSTGREYFNLSWLNKQLQCFDTLPAEDVQATLCNLTARSVSDCIASISHNTNELIVIGGGAKNRQLCRLLAEATGLTLRYGDDFSVDADFIEAAAFAWLAKQTLDKQPGNITTVTGAKQASVLGGIYYP